MALRRNPSQAEAKELLFSLYSIDHYKWCARDIREEISKDEDHLGMPFLHEMELRWVLDQALPTFLVIKLAAVVEECTEILWRRRFPEIKPRPFSQEEKLKLLQGLHEIDVSALMDLWKLRNACAHAANKNATWDEFDTHFTRVWNFVDQFAGKINFAPRKRGRQSRSRPGSTNSSA